MSNINWILGESFWAMRFYDLPNFFICLLFVLTGCQLMRVSRVATVTLVAHCFLPFFLNGFIFPFTYMPDAFAYWYSFNAIRSGELVFAEALVGGNVEQAAAFFAIMPFPLAITPMSLGFFNTFLYSALFFWLYRKKTLTNTSMWFYLLYPSLALYTGMGLRDTFVLVFMVTATQWAREGRWVIFWFPLALLYIIKFQNFFVLAPLLLIYTCFGIRHTGVSLRKGLLTLAIGFAALVGTAPVALPLVNHFRAAMFVEDGGVRGQVALISGASEFVLEGVTSGLYFLMKPFPWESVSAFQVVQSVENIVVMIVLLLIVKVAWRRVPRKLVFWLLFLVFALSIYGLVVFNYGTAARYRYPFILTFVLFVCSDCHVRSLFKPLGLSHWRRGKPPVI